MLHAISVYKLGDTTPAQAVPRVGTHQCPRKMAELPLKGGLTAIVDEDPLPDLARFVWSVQRSGHTVYVRHAGRLYLHRYLMGAKPGQIVDHINGDGLDNRLANLRLATKQLNSLNSKRVKNKTGYIGVWGDLRYKTPCWNAALKVGKRRVPLGRFGSPEDAARAYDEAALIHFGPTAITNFNATPMFMQSGASLGGFDYTQEWGSSTSLKQA